VWPNSDGFFVLAWCLDTRDAAPDGVLLHLVELGGGSIEGRSWARLLVLSMASNHRGLVVCMQVW
jgi:hypothetical protein